jgi:hypothetical protein
MLLMVLHVEDHEAMLGLRQRMNWWVLTSQEWLDQRKVPSKSQVVTKEELMKEAQILLLAPASLEQVAGQEGDWGHFATELPLGLCCSKLRSMLLLQPSQLPESLFQLSYLTADPLPLPQALALKEL